MLRTGIRNLKNNLSRYIRGLQPGEPVLVTDRGRIVAELRSPYTGDMSGREPRGVSYASLVAAGVVRPASRSGDPFEHWPSARQLLLPPGTAADLLDADRGD